MTTPTLLRSDLDVLTGLAAADLAVIWREARDAVATEAALRDILPALVDTYGAAAATVAADWYDDLRDEKRVARRFTAIPAAIDDTGTQALVGWALSEATDYAAFTNLVTGGAQRRILNFSRLTLTGSAVNDPASSGWQRTGVGECGFCRMLIGRGAVYSEATADFASHDNCRCQAVPAFDGLPKPVEPFTPSTRGVSDADRARARAYIAEHNL